MIDFFKRLFSEPSIEDKLKQFGGEESPYAALTKNKPGEAKPDEGESIVFSGSPAGRTFSCDRGSKHEHLRGTKAKELGLLITQKGDGYFWRSRSSIPLTHTKNGNFHYFTADARGAFIKIVEAKGRFHYVEGFTYSMVSFLLWGEGMALNLKPANQTPQTTTRSSAPDRV